MRWYTDGAGWNGTVSRWAVVNDDEFERIFEKAEPHTNNQTEYFAMREALKLAKDNDEICSDSELVVRQLLGEYRVKDKKLKPLQAECAELLRQKRVKLTIIGREGNNAGQLLERTGRA